jgi:nicotinate-nucleotide adenylyltransferase
MSESSKIGFLCQANAFVWQVKMPLAPLIATEIHQAVAFNQNVAPLVFARVARYIDQHHLYQTAR